MATVIITPRDTHPSTYQPNTAYNFTVSWVGGSTGFDRINDISVEDGASVFLLNRGGGNYWYQVRTGSNVGGRTVITIRENAVTEGNEEYRYSFDYGTGPPPANITLSFSDTFGRIGGTTTLNIEADIDITGLGLNDFTVTNGVLSDFQGSGRSYTATLTFPETGSGTTTVALAENSVNEENAAVQATIFYGIGPPLEIHTGYPRRYVRSIGDNDPEGLNDVPIFFLWRSDADGFEDADITVTGAEKQGFRKVRDRFFEVFVRPPDNGTGAYTVTVAANAVSGGNSETSATFNYTDVVETTTLFNWDTALPNLLRGVSSGLSTNAVRFGIVVEANSVFLLGNVSGNSRIYVLTRDGQRKSAKDIETGMNIVERTISVYLSRFPEGKFLGSIHFQDTSINRVDLYRDREIDVKSQTNKAFLPSEYGFTDTEFGTINVRNLGDFAIAVSADINRWGLYFVSRLNAGRGRVIARGFNGEGRQISLIPLERQLPAYSIGDRVYQRENVYRVSSDTQATYDPYESFEIPDNLRDYSVYGHELFFAEPLAAPNFKSIDLRKYRPPEARQRILPQVIQEGEKIPLKHFVSGATTILFDEDWQPPAWLSIDSNFNLTVASGVLRKDAVALVRLRAYSLRAETPLQFYLLVKKKTAPVWKAIQTLPIENGETVNLFGFVENADRVEWKTDFAAPSGVALNSVGELTITNQAKTAVIRLELTAVNDNGSTDIAIDVLVSVPQAISVANPVSTRGDYRLLIEEIGVTEDLLNVPAVSFALDALRPYQFTVDSLSVVLSSDRGKYDGRVSGNFWDTNALNKNGLFTKISLWVDMYDASQALVQSVLLFQGRILNVDSKHAAVTAVLNCVDDTYAFRYTGELASEGLKKSGVLVNVEETYQGVYAPENNLLPILPDSATIYADDQVLPISQFPHAPQALTMAQEAYLTSGQVFVSGGYADVPLLMEAKTPYRYRTVASLVKYISESAGYFNPKIVLPDTKDLAEPHISSRGNVAFHVEETAVVKTVVDWMYDASTQKTYFLLSHPSAYIQDTLESYDRVTDTYETVHTFDYGVAVCQFTSSDYDTFYIIATTGSDIDPIEWPAPPNTNEAFFDKWDSSRESNETHILKYTKSTKTENVFLSKTDAYPVQIGIHYMAGFENERHIRLREGIFSEARSTFKIHDGSLYYRFATRDNFGVAKKSLTSGNAAAVLSVPSDEYLNNLNFDFDVLPNGDVLMPYADGEFVTSTLKVKRFAAAFSENNTGDVFTDTKELSELTVLGGSGGAYLGCHEAFYANGYLYFLAPIQHAYTESDEPRRDHKTTAGAVLYCMDVNSFEITALKTYDFVQLSCRSFVEHENQVYFAEYPNASTHYAPSNENLPGWDANTRQNTSPNKKEWLYQIDNDKVAPVVSPWYQGRAFNATAVKMLSAGDQLHAIVRYADKYDISASNSDAGKPENEQWLVFGRDIEFYAESYPTGNTEEALLELSKISNTRTAIKDNRIYFENLNPIGATLSTGLGDSASQLNYRGTNLELPTSGYLLIDEEVIHYTSRTASRLSGLTRGVNGTTADAHTEGTRVLFLDGLLDATDIENINPKVETNKFFNVIRASDGSTEVSDPTSVAKYRERAFSISLLLSNHQVEWQRYVYRELLARLKSVRSVVRLTTTPQRTLSIGDVIYLNDPPAIQMPVEIVSLKHVDTGGDQPRQTTELVCQELVFSPPVTFGSETSISDKSYTAYTEASFTVPAATGGTGDLRYFMKNLPPGWTFNEDTLTVSGSSRYPSVFSVTLVATDGLTKAERAFQVTIQEKPLGFIDLPSSVSIARNSQVRLKMPHATGGDEDLRYTLTGLPSDLSFNRAARSITGTTTDTRNSFTLTYAVTDGSGASHTRTLTLTLTNALVFTSTPAKIFPRTDQNWSITLPEATGGVGTKHYSVSGLRTGETFDAETRTLSGTASATDRRTITYTARDSASGTPNEASFEITLVPGTPLRFPSPPATITVPVGSHPGGVRFPQASGGFGRVTYETFETGAAFLAPYTLTVNGFTPGPATTSIWVFVGIRARDERGSASYTVTYRVYD